MAQAYCGSSPLSAPAVSRLVARHPASGYLDLLARLALDEATDAAALLTWSRDQSLPSDQGTSADGSQHARGVNPEWLAGFALAAAAVIDAKGMRHQVTVHDIVRLLELAHRAEPHQDMATEHRDLWLDAHYLSGSTRHYPYVRSDAVDSRSWRVSVDELNPHHAHADPAVPGAESVWLAELSRAFTEDGLSALSLPDGPSDPLHRVGAQTCSSSIGGPLVSVVIPVFEPDEGPAFSLASITHQSWSNLEVLICDDGSGPQGQATLLQWADLDPRARIVRSERNSGAYAAMNMGLAHARGEFVTFQGSDDWSHPQRIERQVKALQQRPQAMGTLSHMVQVDDRMSLTVLGRPAIGINASSLLFRRGPVLRQLGGLDTVRRAGDNEFIGRMRAVYGRDAVALLTEKLALVRRTPGSLSRDDLRLLFRHPERVHYRTGYQRWHQHIAGGSTSPWVPPPQRAPIPALERVSGVATPAIPTANIVLLGAMAANAASVPDVSSEVVALAESTSGTPLRLGLMDLPNPLHLTGAAQPPPGQVVDLINSGQVAWLLPEAGFEADLVVVRDPASLVSLGGLFHGSTVDTAVLVADYDPTGNYDPSVVETLLHGCSVAKIRWLPATRAVSDLLRQSIDASSLLPPRLWGAVTPIRPTSWSRHPQPLVGLAMPSKCVPDRELALWAKTNLPQTTRTRLWCRDSQPQLAKRLRRPVNMVTRTKMSEAAFLRHVSYVVVPPEPARASHLIPYAIRALQQGCVVILDPVYRQHFGDAALYTDEHTVDDWVGIHLARPDLYQTQQSRGEQFLREHLSGGSMRANLGLMLDSARG